MSLGGEEKVSLGSEEKASLGSEERVSLDLDGSTSTTRAPARPGT